MIKEISTSNGVPVNFGPLSIILFVTALKVLQFVSINFNKDLFEDMKRHNSDSEENNRKVELLTNSGEF